MNWCKGQFLLLQILFTLSSNYCNEDLSDISLFVKSSMNHNELPCENFFKFVCGNAKKNNHNEEDHSPADIMDYTKFNFFSYIEAIFKRIAFAKRNEKLNIEKKFYSACMNIDRSLNETMETYLNFLIESDKMRLNWQDVAKYYASKIGETFLFQVKLDKTKTLLIKRPIDSMFLKLPYDSLTIELIDYYLQEYCKIFSYFPEYNIVKVQLYYFARRMHEIAHNTESHYLRVSIDSLNFYQNLQINWLGILQAFATGSGTFLTPFHEILIDTIYLKELSTILSRTSDFVIALYITFNFMYDKNVIFFSHKVRPVSSYERSHDCINLMPMKEGIQLHILRLKKINTSKMYVKKLFHYLKEEIKKEFENSWLDDYWKQLMITAINEVTLEIVSLNKVEAGNINNFKKNTISYNFAITDNALQNYINFKKAQMVHYFQLYSGNESDTSYHGRNKRDIKSDFIKYKKQVNRIQITLPLLFTPNFNPSAPLAYNLGRIVTLLANELLRAHCDMIFSPDYFSDFHRNIRNKTSVKVQKTRCLINQYDSHNIDGVKTMKENYAANLGLKVAFNTMKHIIRNDLMNEKLFSLPDFQEYTSEQLFFIFFANTHCRENGHRYQSYMHFFNATRVNIPLKNMREFSEAFNCQESASMNPMEKCDFLANENFDNV